MKFVVAAFVLCTILFASNAQVADVGPKSGIAIVSFPPSDFFLNILRIQAQKLLGTPGGLPEDLELRVVETLNNAEAAFTACNTNAQATMHWLQIRCITLQLKISKSELKAIEDEANARAAAATTTTIAAAAAASV